MIYCWRWKGLAAPYVTSANELHVFFLFFSFLNAPFFNIIESPNTMVLKKVEVNKSEMLGTNQLV